MSKLLKTGKDAVGDTVSPERVDWSSVKCLWVHDMLDLKNRPVLFAPCVVWPDGTWARLTDTFDIGTARQTCAKLSAIHDVPVQDWTRLVPETVPREGFLMDMEKAGFLPPEERDILPDKMPEWGCGWYATDHLFAEGATDADFFASLEETGKHARAVFSKQIGACPEQLKTALLIHNDEAIRRWVMLHAANDKPQPAPVDA